VLEACAWGAGHAATRRADACAGTMAALGFALKPHFLLGWLAVEASLVVIRPRARSWLRPAAMAVAASIVIYGVIVLAFVPQYLANARDVAAVYGGLNEPFSVVMRVTELRIWAVAILALLPLWRRLSTSAAPSLVLFAAATGFLAAALLQFKGWGYHLYPFRVFVLVYFAAVVNALVGVYAARLGFMRAGRAVTALALILVSLWSARAVAHSRRSAGTGPVAWLVELLQGREPDNSIALLSMRYLIFPAFPSVNYAHATWVLRHHSLWFLPGLYVEELHRPSGDTATFRPVPAMPSLERKYFEEIIDDLCARPPRILVVEPPVRGPPGRRSLDLLAYYAQDPRVARLITGYTPIDRNGPFVAYSRASDASCGNGSRLASAD
jgi:hypothetical protein